jgi:SNF2 family DNA or RNA helicase
MSYEVSRPWMPHAYQRNAVKFLMEHAAAGLFLDPGLGKTSITLAAILMLKRMQLVSRVLVIAPLRVCYSVWPKEVQKWTDFGELRVEILHGDKKDEALAREADIYVINPEGLTWLTSKFKKLPFDVLVVDESSKFKHINTQRFKLLKPHLRNFRRRYILTGTPAPNGLLDLFGQAYVMDQGAALGPYITHYRNTYFDATGFGGYTWVPRPGAAEMIYDRLRPYVLRLEARDYLELPEQIDNFISVELPPDARKVYDDMERVMLSELTNGEVVTAMGAAAATMKCRQIANGGLYRQLGVRPAVNADRWADLHTAKVEAIQDLVEELNGSPLLIAYDFEHDRERLLAALGDHTPWIGGGTSPKASAEIERRWNAGEIPVLLGHPQAMGHGLNLQGACGHIAWHSLTWDLELFQQFIQRVLRQGNAHKRVFVHYVLARNTVDEVILKALRSKDRTQSSLLKALKGYAEEKISTQLPVVSSARPRRPRAQG